MLRINPIIVKIKMNGPAVIKIEYIVCEKESFCVTLNIFENKITKIIRTPIVKTENPVIYASKDVLDFVNKPIINDIIPAYIKALYIVEYQYCISIFKIYILF
jgi:hypothetical protein